jgi:hypothetical protein
MKIIVPVTELQTRPNSGTCKSPVAAIPTPPRDQAAVIEIWIEALGEHTSLRLYRSRIAGRLRQHGGGRVWVVSRAATLPWDPRERFASYIDDARRSAARLKGWNGQAPMTICLHDPAVPGGDLVYFEMAVPTVDDGK